MRILGAGIALTVLLVCFDNAQGAGCGAWTGGDAANLQQNEHPTSDTDMALKITDALYQITCTCGIVTRWRFSAWRSGTVILYVISGNKVIGSTSINVPVGSNFNFFEVPLSSKMWISVRNADTPYLGFFTAGEPLITYDTVGGGIPYSYALGQSEVVPGATGTFAGSGSNNNREYAIGAYVEIAHEPMFTNLPYETTVYSHDLGAILTVSVTDLDPDDVSNLVLASVSIDTMYFSFDSVSRVVSYDAQHSPGTYTVTVSVSDGCHADVTESLVINIINEGPTFDNLPASMNVSEDATAAYIYTILTSDVSGDTVTCSLDSVNPGSGIFTITSNEIRYPANPGFDFDTATYYDLRISCTDSKGNTIYSNFQFDIEKNEPPSYNAGTGFLPASVAVSSASAATIYTLDVSDPENDAITYVINGCSGAATCPFTMSAAGVITSNMELTEEGYDVQVTISDADNNVGPYVLSVLVSVDPRSDTLNVDPVLTNLDATLHVMENTAANTWLYQLSHTDQNPTDTFTYTRTGSTSVDSYFTFNAATAQLSTSASMLDFETVGAGPFEFDYEVDDGVATATGTLTISVENVNEGPTITITTTSLTIGEGPRDTMFPDPGLGVTDVDAGDTHTWSMSCGADSKYFYLTGANRINLAREYDMDTGLSGSAECVITVTDAGGLADSGTVTLTVTNSNDNSPQFPYDNYAFVLATTETFFTMITDLAVTDGDNNNFGTSGGITYAFGAAADSTFFQIDFAGVLYVSNVASFSAGDQYVFQVTATDSGALVGTTTITIIFSTFSVITTTAAPERRLVFMDDYLNPFWLLLVGLVLLAVVVVVGLIVWFDPRFQEWLTYKMFRLSEICREKPKEPKRSLVHPAPVPAKLTVTVNNRAFESDPDNVLPWELLAKDAEEAEVNEVQERLQRRKEQQDREYLQSGASGRGKGPASSASRPESESPKYAQIDNQAEDDGGEDQWGNLHEKRVPSKGSPTVVTPVGNAWQTGGTIADVGEISPPHSQMSERSDQKSRTQRRHSISQLDEW